MTDFPTQKKSAPCANSKVMGCTGIVNQRGNILCNQCLGNRASLFGKPNSDNSEFLNKIRVMEEDNTTLNEKLLFLTEEKNRIIEDHNRELKSLKLQKEEDIKQLLANLKITRLKNEELIILNSDNEDKYQKLLSELKEKEKETVRLEEEMNRLKEETKRLKSIHDKFDNYNSNLTSKNKELLNQNDTIADENDKLIKRNEQLRKTNEELEKMNQTLSSENNRLVQENSLLSKENNVENKVSFNDSTSDSHVLILTPTLEPETHIQNAIIREENSQRRATIFKKSVEENLAYNQKKAERKKTSEKGGEMRSKK
jgi:hypothetical protein